jgi:uncharacterized protein (TIGR00369 family)
MAGESDRGGRNRGQEREHFAGMTMRERMQGMAAGTWRAPSSELLGLEFTHLAPDTATVEMDVQPAHANPMGSVQGGILTALSDLAMGGAFASGLGEGESFTTLELKINFLKPVWTGRLRAEARVVKRGRTAGLTECDVRNGDGDLIARASSTCMVLRGADAEGR